MAERIEKLSRILKVLGDSSRLSIVMSIGNYSLSVTEIINVTGLSQTLVSFHLRTLREAGIVKPKRDGPFIYYSLSDRSIMDVLNDLSHLKNSNAEKSEPARKRELVNQRR